MANEKSANAKMLGEWGPRDPAVTERSWVDQLVLDDYGAVVPLHKARWLRCAPADDELEERIRRAKEIKAGQTKGCEQGICATSDHQDAKGLYDPAAKTTAPARQTITLTVPTAKDVVTDVKALIRLHANLATGLAAKENQSLIEDFSMLLIQVIGNKYGYLHRL